MPPATAVNYTTWIIAGFSLGLLHIDICRIGGNDVSLSWWGNDLDGCPLASCPTAVGVVVEGCPVVY
ncbi:oligopeptide transporter 7 [Quercus suber]|uniref:Oligopeptide transporter 7 n=1 Tax=Quercus suber TaxID=58331 RepID=A0AAW0JHG5_QUESU